MKLERRKLESRHRSFEVLSVMASIGALLGLFIWGLSLPESSSPEQRASNYLKILGYSVWQVELNGTREPFVGEETFVSQRGPSSIFRGQGFISRDPWGSPYIYEIKREKQLLFIWSQGPNKINNSSKSIPTFGGDDLGYILDLKMKQ